ncbi:hypothetical protein EBZ38_08755 [bacterium]|nr:hypothetical protein [bacterium]
MAKLTIKNTQKDALDLIDQNLESAFLEGTDSSPSGLPPPENLNVLGTMPKYNEFNTDIRNSIKLVFKQVVASILKTLNIYQPLPANRFTGTIVLKTLNPGVGMDGSITVVDGMVTGYTPPT